jgi:hypothetical protein
MIKLSLTVFFIFFTFNISAQSKIEADLDPAIQNAKKGIYWGLKNLPLKKAKIESDLVAEDRLYASVKVIREFNGFKLESTGFSQSNQVSIKIYRSIESLKKEGYLRESYAAPEDD